MKTLLSLFIISLSLSAHAYCPDQAWMDRMILNGNPPLIYKASTIPELKRDVEDGLDLNLCGKSGERVESLLMWAFNMGYSSEEEHRAKIDYIKFLLDKGADPNYVAYGEPVLRSSVIFCNVEILDSLLSHGANIYFFTEFDRFSRLASWVLSEAASFNCTEYVMRLDELGVPLFERDMCSAYSSAGSSYDVRYDRQRNRQGRPEQVWTYMSRRALELYGIMGLELYNKCARDF